MGVITRNTQVLFERAEVQLINKDLFIKKCQIIVIKQKDWFPKKVVSCDVLAGK